MRILNRTFVLAVLMAALPALLSLPAGLGSSQLLQAQTVVDPSGHWVASAVGSGSPRVEIDLARDSKGDFVGTISLPAENVKGLPLRHIAIEGHAVNFSAREDQPFQGSLSDDGKEMSGELLVEGFTMPMSLVRTGEPSIEAPPQSAPISKELEGTWNGTLNAGGTALRLVLTMSNQPDGTATGRIVNLDEGSLTIPVGITQKASSVTLDAKIIGGSYSGVLNAAGTELVGTYSQGERGVPLTFKRAGN